MSNLTSHWGTILYLCPINNFKLPVRVYFMLGNHQIVTTVLSSLHRTDIPLYRGEKIDNVLTHYGIAVYSPISVSIFHTLHSLEVLQFLYYTNLFLFFFSHDIFFIFWHFVNTVNSLLIMSSPHFNYKNCRKEEISKSGSSFMLMTVKPAMAPGHLSSTVINCN